jgi:putative copper export protein
MTILALLQAASPPPPPGGDAVTWNEVLGEYIKFVGYFLSIGAIGYRYLILPRFEKDGSGGAVIGRTTAATLGLTGILLLLLSFLGSIEINALLHHRSFVASLPKAIGRFQFQMVALAASLVGFTIARRASIRFGWPLAAIGILAVVLQPLVTSRGFSGRVNAVHILAASTWLGTLTVMLFAAIRALARAPAGGLSRERATANVINAFTPVALTAATILGITGVTTAWLHLKKFSNLWTSDYGRALIVKLCFVIAVVLMGWWNWKRVKPSLAGSDQSVARLNRSATTEVVLAAIVLAVTAVLVSLPSPR